MWIGFDFAGKRLIKPIRSGRFEACLLESVANVGCCFGFSGSSYFSSLHFVSSQKTNIYGYLLNRILTGDI